MLIADARFLCGSRTPHYHCLKPLWAASVASEQTFQSRRRGWPVIDGGSRGAVGVATQVAGASYVDVGEADTYAWECEATHESAERALGTRTVKHEWGVNCDWRCK